MKNAYNLREVMDKQLHTVALSQEVEKVIKEKCRLQTQSHIACKRKYQAVAKVAILLVCIVGMLSGSVYAITNSKGFSAFVEGSALEKVIPYIQTINKENKKSDVRLVVEEAIANSYQSTLIFSLINEGKEPWAEGVSVGSWRTSWGSAWKTDVPILSADGRKLTYYVECHSDNSNYTDKDFEVKIKNIVADKEYEEAIDIPIGELFEKHKVTINTKDYSENSKYKLPLKLNNKLKKKASNKEQLTLQENAGILFAYVGYIEDSLQKKASESDGGLVCYTRNEQDSLALDFNKDYTVGYISEITDVRTGETYKEMRRALEYDSLFKGALGISVFPDVIHARDIPYLKATKITYGRYDVLVDETWKVGFSLNNTTSLYPIDLDIAIQVGEDTLKIEQAEVSVLGVTLKCGYEGNLKNIDRYLLQGNLKVQLQMKDSSIIELRGSHGSTEDKGMIIEGYIPSEESDMYIDESQVVELIINDVYIAIE